MKVTTFLLFLLITACSNGQEQSKQFQPSPKSIQPISIEKIKGIKLSMSDSVLIGNLLSRFTISDDGSQMAFYDLLNKHVLLFDEGGHLKFIVGKQGKGPSEFVNVLAWNFDEWNNLIVYDEAQRMLKIFDSKGQLKDAITIFDNVDISVSNRNLVASDSLIYLPIVETQYWTPKRDNIASSNLIAVLNYKGKKMKMLGKYDPYTEVAAYYGTAPIISLDFMNNMLYATHKNSYRIQQFDINTNKKLAYYGYKSAHYKESPERVEYSMSRNQIYNLALSQSFPNRLFQTQNYVVLYFANLTKKWNETRNPIYKDYYLVIYDKKSHSFISEINLPHQLGTIYDNKLYLLENQNPDNYTIGIYKFVNK